MIMKVVSLNLWMGGKLFPAILDFLAAEDAELLLLQEVHDGHGQQLPDRLRTMDVLCKNLDYEYFDFAHMYYLRTAEGKIPLGNAVLSKYPIKRSDVHFFVPSLLDEYRDIPEHWPIVPRILQQIRLQTDSDEVNVFNMHGVWDLAGDKPTEDRKKMFDIMAQQTFYKPNVVLAGDSNASQGNPLWRTLDSHLKNAFGETPATTFNMRRKDNPGYATAAVDVLYVSSNIEVLSAECPEVDVSDHLPLVARLKID